jgi:hypothetical protein
MRKSLEISPKMFSQTKTIKMKKKRSLKRRKALLNNRKTLIIRVGEVAMTQKKKWMEWRKTT